MSGFNLLVCSLCERGVYVLESRTFADGNRKCRFFWLFML